jgi:hypothetical protein
MFNLSLTLANVELVKLARVSQVEIVHINCLKEFSLGQLRKKLEEVAMELDCQCVHNQQNIWAR